MTRRGKSHAGKKEFTVKCGERLGSENMCGEEVGGERPPHPKIGKFLCGEGLALGAILNQLGFKLVNPTYCDEAFSASIH